MTAPLPWQFERAQPNSDPFGLGGVLLCRVETIAVAGPIQRETASHQRGGDAYIVGTKTVADKAAVAIALDKIAPDRLRLRKELVERIGGSGAAAITLAFAILAKLVRFRGVDTVETNALAMDLNCVAVNHRGTPENGG